MAGIIVLAAAYIISHFYRSFLAVLSPQLTAELGLGPDDLSDALGAWFAAFALSQFLVGVLLDKIGPRWTTASLFAVCGGGGGILFALAGSPATVLFAMVLLGIGCSPVLMASVYMFKRSYDGQKFATLTSTFIAVGLAGNILGASPLAWATETFGWRGVMWGLSILTLVLSALVLILVHDPKKISSNTLVGGGYMDVLKMRELWLILPLIFVNYGVVGGIRGIWAGPYLDVAYQLPVVDIGYITLAMAIAMAVGSLVYGPVDRILNTRKWVIFFGSSISLVALYYLALNPQAGISQVAIILTLMGFCSMFYGVLMAHATANVPDHLAGRGVTLVNFFNMGGVGVMQWLSSAVYRQQIETNDPFAGFQSVFVFYAAVLTLAMLLYLFSRDAKPST